MTTVALVLGSGGARGYAHIGVLEELERRGYRVVSISGASMGALIGGVYAAGALEQYRDWVCSLGRMDVIRLLDVSFRKGAIRGDKVFDRIRQMTGDPKIESLPIAYTAVATDLVHQKEVWFQHGSLMAAMRASVAVPGVFTPVQHKHRLLVDGGVLNPLPIIPVVAARADMIVAVDLNITRDRLLDVDLPDNRYLDRSGAYDDMQDLPEYHQAKSTVQYGGRVDIVMQAVEAMQSSLTEYKIAGYPPDVVIPVAKEEASFHDFHRAEELIEIGRLSAREKLQEIEALGEVGQD